MNDNYKNTDVINYTQVDAKSFILEVLQFCTKYDTVGGLLALHPLIPLIVDYMIQHKSGE